MPSYRNAKVDEAAFSQHDGQEEKVGGWASRSGSHTDELDPSEEKGLRGGLPYSRGARRTDVDIKGQSSCGSRER